MKLKTYALCAWLLLFGQTVRAQQPPSDPIGENLFPPELIMQHQQAIGLSEEQKSFFKAAVRKGQASFTELQWQLQDEVEKVVALVKPDLINEQQVLEQLDKVLNLERDLKRAHMAWLIRLKNKLTPEQQARLREIRNKPQGK